MAQGKRTHYNLVGWHPTAQAPSLEGALRQLDYEWVSRPSLVVHEMGNLEITLTIGNASATFEITDPTVLEDLRYTGPMTLISWLSTKMGLPPAVAQNLLETASAEVRVDSIRVPGDRHHWNTEPGMEADIVLSDRASALVGQASKIEDQKAARDRGRARSASSRQWIEAAVKLAKDQDKSDAQMADELGVPRSTFRDTRVRVERQEKVVEGFSARKKGERLTSEQKKVVLESLANSNDNAAEVGRSLGISPRTVRDLRARTQRTGPPRRTYTATEKEAVLARVRTGVNASQAARDAGVSPRTARGWVRKAKLAYDEEG